MQNRKITFGVLDLFLLVLILVMVTGVAARYILTEKNGILAVTPEFTGAAVSVLITDIEGTSSVHFVEGESFTLNDTATGAVLSDFTVTPAQYYTENEDGELVIAYHDEESGRIDCRGAFSVSGYYSEGVYLLNGVLPITAGMEIDLFNGEIKVTALVIDVSPLS